MSFREKSAWICLLSTLLVFVPYFVHVAGLFQQGRPVFAAEIWVVFALAAVVQALITAATHIAIARQAQREPKDERDRAVESMAYRRAYIVLSISIALLLCLTVWGPTMSVIGLGQWLLLAFVLAEVTNYGCQVLGYRRGVTA
jgi:hypothetical protein